LTVGWPSPSGSFFVESKKGEIERDFNAAPEFSTGVFLLFLKLENPITDEKKEIGCKARGCPKRQKPQI